MRLKTGIESSAYFDLEDYEIGLKKAKEHGYDCIDYQAIANKNCIVFTWDDEKIKSFYKRFKACADKIGIEINQMHGLWPTEDRTEICRLEQFKYYVKQMEIANILDCRYYVIHPIMPYGWEQEEDSEFSWQINLDFLQKLLIYAEQNKVVVCLENIPISMQLGYTKYINKIVNEINSPYLKVCFDVGHANIMKEDIFESIKLLSSNLKCLHVHDNKGRSDEHTCPFFGNIDWDKFTQALKEINYKESISLETYILQKMYLSVREDMQINLSKIAKTLAEKCV